MTEALGSERLGPGGPQPGGAAPGGPVSGDSVRPSTRVEAPPARVRVTAPRRGAASTPVLSSREGSGDVHALYVRSLIRSQLRLSVVFAVGFVVATAAFVLAIVLTPALDDAFVLGVPISWLLLALGIYPLVLTVAGIYARIATRNEARYRSLTEEA